MKISVVPFLLVLFCTGCAFFNSDPLLLSAVKEDQSAKEGGSRDYLVKPYYPEAFPVTLDRLMLAVRHEAGKSVPAADYSFQVEDDGFLATRFNIYAAARIRSGADFEPTAEREKFFTELCGKEALPFILEYLRILERRTVSSFVTGGIFGPENPKLSDVYDRKVLDQLQILLEKAAAAAKNTPYAPVIDAEYAAFLIRRKELETAMENLKPVFYAERSWMDWQSLDGIMGDPVKVPSAALCYVSDDRKSIVLRIIAYEPAMDKRRTTGRTRDYRKAWSDDGFEIFIVPDMKKPDQCKQFVITSGGVLWDAHVSPGRVDASWNSNAVYKQFDVEGAWRAELIIPFADFGFDKVPEEPFAMNIYRYRRVKGEAVEASAWAPRRYGANLQPDVFGKIIWN